MCNGAFQYVNLRTRYIELMTLTSQYIKFILETQRRLEEEEVNTPKHSRRRVFGKGPQTLTVSASPANWCMGKSAITQYSNSVGTEKTFQYYKIVLGLESVQWWSKLLQPIVPAHRIHYGNTCLSFLNTVVMPSSQTMRISALAAQLLFQQLFIF